MISPITPPFELMNQWYKKACKDPYNGGQFIMSQVLKDICNSAAQWGADQELEACLKWLAWESPTTAEWVNRLRAARRPKAPSKAESALNALEHILRHSQTDHGANTIRLALERLKELEGAND